MEANEAACPPRTLNVKVKKTTQKGWHPAARWCILYGV